VVDDCREQRAPGRPARDAQDSGGERKQQEDAERGQHGDERNDVGFGLGACDQDSARCGDQHECQEQHESDTAGAAARPDALDRRASLICGRLRLRHDRRGIGAIRLVLSAPAAESTQGFRPSRLGGNRRLPHAKRFESGLGAASIRIRRHGTRAAGFGRQTLPLVGLMAGCRTVTVAHEPPFTTRKLWDTGLGCAGPIFLNFLLVLTAARNPGGVNHSGNPDEPPHPRTDGEE
jgi:hypothetical protein